MPGLLMGLTDDVCSFTGFTLPRRYFLHGYPVPIFEPLSVVPRLNCDNKLPGVDGVSQNCVLGSLILFQTPAPSNCR